MRILVDGDYRRHAQGTGISTYSRTLVRTLTKLGHEVSWLSGANASSRPDALADAASIADRPETPRGLREKLQTAARMAQGLIDGAVEARQVAQASAVIPANASDPAEAVYLAPNVLVNAHYRHMLLRQFTEVRRPAGIDVLHLSAPLPIRMSGVRTVTTIHDLAPIRLPYTTPDNKAEFTARVRQSAARSDLIITVSEASKAEIVSLLGVDPAKVAVTWQYSDLEPLSAEDQRVLPRTLERLGLEPDRYALFVGALEPKKNLRRLIEAFLDVDTDLPLVLAGPRAWLWDQDMAPMLAALGEKARSRLKFTGYLSRDDIRRLYAGAHVFLFPSLYEGFGLPALDALAFARPALVGRTGSLPEVCGDAALYVDPLDREDIRRGVERLLGDAALRAQLSAAGPAQAQRYSADAYVRRLADAYALLG